MNTHDCFSGGVTFVVKLTGPCKVTTHLRTVALIFQEFGNHGVGFQNMSDLAGDLSGSVRVLGWDLQVCP